SFKVSIIIMVYARRKFASIPFNRDYLKAKYQVKEVLNFSFSLLPSVMVSALMHTLSLVPTLLWVNGIIDYPFCCLFYFSAHSLNCILTKLTLIACHKGMRQRFQLLFVARLRFRTPRMVQRDAEQEGKEYFDEMRKAFDAGAKMAPASDYLFLSIETLINTISMAIMIPCFFTLLRTQGMHGNCKVLLVTSAAVQSFLLCVQTALFAHNFITENLLPATNQKEAPFLMVQNGLFTMSSYLSLSLVLERTFAIWSAAQYETSGHHLFPLFLMIGGSIAMAILHVYAIYW
ncbi:hypothetical protein PENTCL1PPCAC_766, partial [Pristionchus entomophagus]